jgi:hypothetical protein
MRKEHFGPMFKIIRGNICRFYRHIQLPLQQW